MGRVVNGRGTGSAGNPLAPPEFAGLHFLASSSICLSSLCSSGCPRSRIHTGMGRKPPVKRGSSGGKSSYKGSSGGGAGHQGSGYKGVSKKKQHSRRALKAMQVRDEGVEVTI